MSLFGRIGKFAKSPQGKKLMKQAQEIAKDPKTKQKIADARERLAHKDKPSSGPAEPPASKPGGPTTPPGGTTGGGGTTPPAGSGGPTPPGGSGA